MVAEVSDRELVVTRIFDAPRTLVFEAWTTPAHLARWWGPKAYTLPFSEVDFRVCGAYRFCMRSPEGRDYWVRGIYREIVVPEQIVWTARLEEDSAADAELLMTITFEDLAGKTRLTVHQAPFKTVAERNDAVRGWTESLERLAVQVTG